MSFRRYVTFNTHDCSVQVGERIEVELGFPRRCGIVLRAAVRHGGQGLTVEEATDHINKRLNCLYSEGDVSNAFKKLEKLELVERVGRRTYRASPGALDAWAEVDKIRR